MNSEKPLLGSAIWASVSLTVEVKEIKTGTILTRFIFLFRYLYLNGMGRDSRFEFDGVNSLDYRVKETKRNPLYTKTTVQIDQQKIRQDLNQRLRSVRGG